jgi:hypothetical protein
MDPEFIAAREATLPGHAATVTIRAKFQSA